MVSSKEAKPSINPPTAVVKVAGVLSVLLSRLFCSGRCVTNKCFRCDAIGLAMLEEGAAQCGSCWGCPHRRTKQGPEQIIEDLSKWCLPRDGCLRVRNLRLANQEDEMSIAGRRNGLALGIGAIMLALLVTSGGISDPRPKRNRPHGWRTASFELEPESGSTQSIRRSKVCPSRRSNGIFHHQRNSGLHNSAGVAPERPRLDLAGGARTGSHEYPQSSRNRIQRQQRQPRLRKSIERLWPPGQRK